MPHDREVTFAARTLMAVFKTAPYKTGEGRSDANPFPMKQMHGMLVRGSDGNLYEVGDDYLLKVEVAGLDVAIGGVTIADGADVAQGTKGDTSTSGTVLGFLSSLYTKFFGTPVAIKVDGSAVTQPISAASLPLPAGAATSAKQDTAQTSLSSIAANTAATSPTDRSGTIASGGAAQTAMAINAARNEAWVYNVDPTETMWISWTGTALAAAAGSAEVPARTGWSGKVTSAVSVVAATTGHKFTAGER